MNRGIPRAQNKKPTTTLSSFLGGRKRRDNEIPKVMLSRWIERPRARGILCFTSTIRGSSFLPKPQSLHFLVWPYWPVLCKYRFCSWRDEYLSMTMRVVVLVRGTLEGGISLVVGGGRLVKVVDWTFPDKNISVRGLRVSE